MEGLSPIRDGNMFASALSHATRNSNAAVGLALEPRKPAGATPLRCNDRSFTRVARDRADSASVEPNARTLLGIAAVQASQGV